MFELDATVLAWINFGADSPEKLVEMAKFLSRELPKLLVGAMLGAWLAGDRALRAKIHTAAVAILIAWALARLGQSLIPAERPFVEGAARAWLAHRGSYGFPSSHGSVAFALAVLATRWARQPWVWTLAWGLALSVAWSRIALGLHYPSDILGGLLAGFVAALAAERVMTQSRVSSARAANATFR